MVNPLSINHRELVWAMSWQMKTSLPSSSDKICQLRIMYYYQHTLGRQASRYTKRKPTPRWIGRWEILGIDRWRRAEVHSIILGETRLPSQLRIRGPGHFKCLLVAKFILVAAECLRCWFWSIQGGWFAISKNVRRFSTSLKAFYFQTRYPRNWNRKYDFPTAYDIFTSPNYALKDWNFAGSTKHSLLGFLFSIIWAMGSIEMFHISVRRWHVFKAVFFFSILASLPQRVTPNRVSGILDFKVQLANDSRGLESAVFVDVPALSRTLLLRPLFSFWENNAGNLTNSKIRWVLFSSQCLPSFEMLETNSTDSPLESTF